MKILQIHNRYRAGLGGEDVVVEAERELLESHGHVVEQLFADNLSIGTEHLVGSTRAGLRAIWSQEAYHRVAKKVAETRPELVHFHNTFATLSPSAIWAAKRQHAPIVLTLHNYRITCASSILFRDENPCTECVGHFPWPALRHRCSYNASVAAGMVIAMTQIVHGWLNTYTRNVDAFIALSQGSADIFRRVGLPAERIHVKPNFVPDFWEDYATYPVRKSQAIFVGQVSRAKGVDLLLSAWKALNPTGYHLLIVGDGPERESIERSASARDDIVWLGRLSRTETLKHMAESRFLVLPSRWDEPFGMVVVEALSLGTPAIVPSHSAFAEDVGKSPENLVFSVGNVDSLVAALHRGLTLSEEEWVQYSRSAWYQYLKRYTPDQNYLRLMTIYAQAIARAQQHPED